MNSFTIYKEYYELITLLNEKDQQELLLAIAKYMFEDIEPELNEKQVKIFNNLKRPLDVSKYNSKRRTKKETEEKPKENQIANQKETHQDVNVYVNVNVNVIKEIINYLNTKTNSHYKHTSEKTQRLIQARFNEGYNLQDFKDVIDKKSDEWLETEFEKFLRPETLFGTKFESYLNQKDSSTKGPEKYSEEWWNKL